MKRIFFSLIVLLCSCGIAMAQSSMTDAQVIEFVMKEQKAGSSQAQIVTKLMQKGVDIQQIRRIKKQFDSNGGLSMGKVSNGKKGSDSENRLRVNNGEKKNSKLTNTSQRIKGVTANTTGKNQIDEDEFSLMRHEFNELYPDSLNEEESEFEEFLKYKNKPKVFGRDIFNSKKLTFEPNMNISTPQNYRLGPGDVVYVEIYGGSQKTIEETISPDGTITIEGYGPIVLSGLTVDQANARLRSTVGARYSSSQVKMTVGQTRTIMVNVMGEVKTPGTYTLSAFATVFHALYMAGGTTDIGTLRNIKVYRQGRLITQVDVYDYILNGKLTGNVRLTDNDVIVVGPYDCLVNVSGKVKRPMYYEMKKNESMQTLLKYAGGFSNDAYKQSVRVIRKTGRQYTVFNVTEFDMSSFHIADGDSVSVDSILDRYENMVEVKGAVFRPGMYQLGGDVTSVGSLLKMAEGVTEDAFVTHAVMHRMKQDRTLEVLSVDINGILNGTTPDVPLRNEDVLFVPSTKEITQDKTITISGEVFYPGIYKYAENSTIEDIILQAGGLKETASTMKVQVSRRIFDPKATSTSDEQSQVFEFMVKDGFVVDGESAFKLLAYDEVYVRKSPGYNEQQSVDVDGEVLFRGKYALGKKNTRLSEIIKAAGGINNQGYPEGARLTRKITEDERQRMMQLVQMQLEQQQNADSEIRLDSVSMAKKLNIAETISVGIDLKSAMLNPGSDDDIVLRDGDRIFVPQYNGTVRVSGEVMYANTVAYEKGKSPKYYISQAGGYGLQAKKSHAYIIYANGKVGKLKDGAKVHPGCEIVVPMKQKRKDGMQVTQQWVSIGSVIATVAAVIVSVIK